jgi:lipooligosaccharide transport system ATP-binding protein
MINTAIIEAANLTKKYKDILAVNDISFTITKGKCFGFLGPNGAGKSTTMKMIYGLSPVTSGKLNVFGLDIQKNLSRIKAKLGVVPQENNLDPDLNVYENLLIYANYFGIPRDKAVSKAKELLKFVNIEEKADKKADALSGGMKRRLIIARALVNDPNMLILDEPTTGLDPQSRHLLWDKLFELKAKGITLLLTTHYMDEAYHLCDYIYIMDKGKIITQGSPRELIDNNLPPYVIEYNGDRTLDASIIGKLGDNLDSYQKTFASLLLFVKDFDKAKNGLNELNSHITLRKPNLEDVFIKLTGREIGVEQ